MSAAGGPRKATALVLACIGASLATFWPTWASMIAIWSTSDTFAHGFLIAPIALYLVYMKRDALAALPAQPCWLGALALALAGILWTVGKLVDVQVVEQLAAVAVIPAIVLLVLGAAWFRSLIFPLGFLFLAVPFGEGVMPYLIDWTADFVVVALKLTGIPVYREGTFFVIPSGSWSVVSGCSGMRYLMATLTVGALFAYLNYRSLGRRVAFVLVAFCVAIVANWLRAYGIVMIAHLSGMRLALGIDHYIYGWAFFGLVIFLLMTVGSLWSEGPAAPQPAPPVEHRAAPLQARAVACATLLALGLIAVWPLIVGASLSASRGATAELDLDVASLAPEWQPIADDAAPWRPRFVGAAHHYEAGFAAEGRPVWWHVAWYPQQRQGAEVFNARNRLVHEKFDPWRAESLGVRHSGGSVVPAATETLLRERAGERRLLVWRANWIAGGLTVSSYVGKIREAAGMLAQRGNPGAAIVLFTEVDGDDGIDDARARLARFTATAGPLLTGAFANATE